MPFRLSLPPPASRTNKNPGDGKHGTFFQLLPTPRSYARFPFFNLVNSQDVFASLASGGAFQPWTFGYAGRPGSGNRGLATLDDISADWELTSRCALSAYFGRATGHSVIRSIYPNGKNANLGYVELGYRF